MRMTMYKCMLLVHVHLLYRSVCKKKKTSEKGRKGNNLTK